MDDKLININISIDGVTHTVSVNEAKLIYKRLKKIFKKKKSNKKENTNLFDNIYRPNSTEPTKITFKNPEHKDYIFEEWANMDSQHEQKK